MKLNEDPCARSRQKTVEALDVLEKELGDNDYLVGNSFTIADLTAASLFYPLAGPPPSTHTHGGGERGVRRPREFMDSMTDRRGAHWVPTCTAATRLPSLSLGFVRRSRRVNIDAMAEALRPMFTFHSPMAHTPFEDARPCASCSRPVRDLRGLPLHGRAGGRRWHARADLPGARGGQAAAGPRPDAAGRRRADPRVHRDDQPASGLNALGQALAPKLETSSKGQSLT